MSHYAESTSGFGKGKCRECGKEVDALHVKKKLDFWGGTIFFCTLDCYKAWSNRRAGIL